MTIFFPDVSSYQTGISFAGCVMVMVKATENDSYANPDYLPAKARADDAGAFFCTYHFLHAGNGAGQASYAYGVVGSEIPLMINCEPTYNSDGKITSAPQVSDAVDFINEYRALGGTTHLLRLPHWYWQANLGQASLVPLNDLGMLLVSSHYTTYSDTGPGWAPYGGMTPVVWQYTSSATLNGVDHVDMNAYKGTLADFQAHASTGTLLSKLIRRLEAGYDSDDIGSTDWLGITEDVNILAALMASNHTLPPLSIGLFGNWGTGKSFFMRRLEDRVALLANAARAGGSAIPPRPSFYCGSIAQITFNAWHYVEADLWASLATRVFEGLNKYLQGTAYRDMIGQLETSQAASAEAEERLEAAQTALRGAKLRLQEQIAEQDGRTLAELAALQPGVGPDVRHLTGTLGLEKEAHVGDVQEVRTRGLLYLGWQALSRYRFRRATWLLALACLAIPAGLLLAWFVARDQPLAATLTSAGALLTGVITTLTIMIAGARKVMSAADHILKAKDQQGQDEVNAAKREVEQQTERVRHEEAEVARVRHLEIPSLDSFIQQRAASSDYRKYLGLVALIQRDFQALSDYLTAPSRPAAAGSTANGQPPVDRIVLYIDDLDRCPPGKVVQVLQAVHLLLAFPLFVVVVGVDSRWLVQSLEHEYDAILSAGKTGRNDAEQAGELTSTPQNYLEKIFQVPFWLRPMAPLGYGRLIRALAHGTAPTGTRATDAAEDKAESAEEQSKPPARPADQPEPEPAPSSAPIDLTPSALIIAEHELAYADKLGPLIPTPRAAKRFINLYRLLKVGLTDEETVGFVGDDATPGEYQVALLLLAIMVGAPTEANTIFRALRNDRLDEWTAVVDEVRPRPWDDPAAASHQSNAAGQLSANDAAKWHRLCQVLDELGPPVTTQGLDAFRSWASRVGRYSFNAVWVLPASASGL